MAIDPHERPVRVINDDTTDQEFQAGHLIEGADPPKNAEARGGFGNRDGKEGFGTDSSGGITALGVNERVDQAPRPADNMRLPSEGADDRLNQDLPARDYIDSRRVPNAPDELAADDQRPDDMLDPDSRVGMGEMEPKQPDPTVTSTDVNAELTSRDAQESGLDL